jgi:hypothetical protein
MSFKISQTIHSSNLKDIAPSMNITTAKNKIVEINFVTIFH